jgi:hypothetical protein
MTELRYSTFSEMEDATIREEGDSEEAFVNFTNTFAKCDPAQRLEILRNWDQLAEASPQPTRLNATYMHRYRQLRSQHKLLSDIGR